MDLPGLPVEDSLNLAPDLTERTLDVSGRLRQNEVGQHRMGRLDQAGRSDEVVDGGRKPIVDRDRAQQTVGRLADGPTIRSDHERLRFDHQAHDGTSTVRSVEPHRLVSWGRKWYLVAWDAERGDWRTFRVDRIEPHTPTGPRFTPRELPDRGDVAAYVARGVASAGFRFQARVTVHAPAEAVAARINPAVGVVEAVDEHTCALATGADSVDTVAVYLGLFDADFEVTEPPELVERLRVLADRYQRALR